MLKIAKFQLLKENTYFYLKVGRTQKAHKGKMINSTTLKCKPFVHHVIKKSEKTSHCLGKNICKTYNQQGIGIQNIWRTSTVNEAKANSPPLRAVMFHRSYNQKNVSSQL